MRPRIGDDGDYPEPEPQIGAVVTFSPVPRGEKPKSREFAIGFHGSDRVDIAKPVRRKRGAE